MAKKKPIPNTENQEAVKEIIGRVLGRRDGSELVLIERRSPSGRRLSGFHIVEILEGGLEIELATSLNEKTASRLLVWLRHLVADKHPFDTLFAGS